MSGKDEGIGQEDLTREAYERTPEGRELLKELDRLHQGMSGPTTEAGRTLRAYLASRGLHYDSLILAIEEEAREDGLRQGREQAHAERQAHVADLVEHAGWLSDQYEDAVKRSGIAVAQAKQEARADLAARIEAWVDAQDDDEWFEANADRKVEMILDAIKREAER